MGWGNGRYAVHPVQIQNCAQLAILTISIINLSVPPLLAERPLPHSMA
jgi:hypothetical protein